MSTRTADPLVQAIADGRLDPDQREALADLMQVVLLQEAEAAAEGPALPENRTSRDAARWQMVASALRVNRPYLQAT